MFSKIGQLIFNNEVVGKTQNFTMGIEVEMQRIGQNGKLSKAPYPSKAGDQKSNPWITNDFLETMSEIITPPSDNDLDAMHYLYHINNSLRIALSPGEMLWPLSMPPALPKDKSKILIAKKDPQVKAYLNKWNKRHKTSEGIPCGIHINLSIKNQIIDMLYTKKRDRFSNSIQLANYLYTIMAQGFLRYRWLLTYLFGMSPVAEKNYFDPGKELKFPIRSIRQSHYGFGNNHFRGDYSNIQNYVNKILKAVKDDILIANREFHGAVRFKGNKNLKDLPTTGVKYIELRMLDLDPSSSVGIRTNTLRFIKLLAIYFLMSPHLSFKEINKIIKRADQKNEEVATEYPNNKCKYQKNAQNFLEKLKLFANQLQLGPEYQEEIQDMIERVNNPKNTPAARLITHLRDSSLTSYALRQAKNYQHSALQSIRPFKGFNKKNKLSKKELKDKLFHGSWEPKK